MAVNGNTGRGSEWERSVSESPFNAGQPSSRDALKQLTFQGKYPEASVGTTSIKVEQNVMDEETSNKGPENCQSAKVEIEDKRKNGKHENKRGKTIPNINTKPFLSSPTGNLSTTPGTIHQSSNGTASERREVSCNQGFVKFGSRSCLKQHSRGHSDDTASRQEDYLNRATLSAQLRYWKDKLIGYETLNLITDYPRPSEINYIGQNIHFDLDTNTSLNLRNLAEELGVSLYTVLLSGYSLMLRIYGNQNDFVIGTLTADSPCGRTKKMNDNFDHTSAIRIQVESTYLLRDFIRQVGGDIVKSLPYQDLPLEKLVEELAVAKDNSRHPIFQLVFGLQNIETAVQNQTDEETDAADLHEPFTVKSPISVAKFDLTAVMDDSGGVLKGLFNYNTTLFKEETIYRFIDTYVYILNQLSTLVNSQTKTECTTIADLTYLNTKQYHQLIHSWNATDKPYPLNKTIHQLFEEQVAKTPNKIAIKHEEAQLTFGELNMKANQLATYLIQEYNIQPDNLIAICFERSEHMIIAILAVLKSGGAYVPIDPNYPDERIRFTLQDTNSTLLLTNEIHKKRLRCIDISDNISQDCQQGMHLPNILSIDSEEVKDKLLLQSVTNPNTLTTSANLAYVIYTSGTTGKPKGVMVEHRRTVHTNFAVVDWYALGDAEVILQFSNYVFEASVEQIFLGLLNGHMLLLISNQLLLNKEKFSNYLIENKVTHLMATPRFLEQQNFAEMSSLRRLVFVGEFLSKELYENIRLNDRINIVNAYGSTETSAISFKLIENCALSIGTPMFDAKCYVLTDNLVPVPIGAVGDLYAGGAGLARGYLNRPDLTAEKFIANPFQTEEEGKMGKNTRLYKTGDLVRWLPDGNLECIGRSDLQVKIRGHRIELGEIESALLGYEGIDQCVALAKEKGNKASDTSGNKYLVGYYVSKEKLDEESIRHYLNSKLPEYMIPTFFVHLNKLPLTPNGKLDRRVLPDPELTAQDNYVAPKNEIEEAACQIWAEVLGIDVDKVGTHDDFIKLGGDSIISIQLVSKLRKKLQVNVSVKDIFQYKSIARLYENVFRRDPSMDSDSSITTEQGMLVGALPLLPIQDWFFRRNFNAHNHWNKSFLIKTPKLDLDRLKVSLDSLVQHHDCFRMRYKKDAISGTYEQYYDGNAQVEHLREFDIRNLGHKENSQAFKTNLQDFLTSWQANFDLTNGPMYSVGYMYGYEDGSARIHFALHHLIVDAMSFRILSEDLRDIYYGKILGNKGSSFRQWTKMIQNYPSDHMKEKSYWNNILSDYDGSQINNLIVSESNAHFTSIELSQEYTRLLLQESNRAYHTQTNDLLLTALGYSLTELTGASVNHIILEGHGREEIDSSIDITRTLGWFTTMYPFRLQIFSDLGTSIKSVKESLRTIPNKGIGFGPIFGYNTNDLPRVSFHYDGELDKENNSELRNKAIWRIVEEDSGLSISHENTDSNFISFNGLIIDGRLKFNIVSKLDEKSSKSLARVFEQQLEIVINNTVNQTRSCLTVSDIGRILSKERLDDLQKLREIEAIYLANSLQQGFIYHALSQGDTDDAYIVQMFWQYQCPININTLKQAWGYAQDKFCSLRVRFDWQEDLVQIIDKGQNLDWRYIDISDEMDKRKQEIKINDIKNADRLERYNLIKGNLFRVYLIKLNWDFYSCIFSNHHAILDGWSIPILLEFIHDTYLRLDRKERIILQPDHAYGAAQRYIQDHKEDDKPYWVKYVNQIEGRSNLSGLILKNDMRLSDHKQVICPADKKLAISGNVYTRLKLLSQQEGVTLNAILQYVWHKVLHVYGNSKQTIVGTTLSGRVLPVDDIEKSVGLYINTLPLIVDHQESKHVIESIKDIQSSINEFNSRSNVNLAKLQPSAERLFHSLFVFENFPNPTGAAQNELKLKFTGVVQKLDYPLSAKAYETNNELIIQLQYAGELFSEDAINNLLLLMRTLLEQLPSRAHHAVAHLNYLDSQQYDQIVHKWNATDHEYPADKTIHQSFEEQVAKTPDNVAIVYEEIQLTYKELNKRANQLASFLIKEYNTKPDSLIALCLDRNEHMIIAILAVLKSGGAYVPIDPSYPDERIQYILQDTGTSLLLTNEVHQEKLDGIRCSENLNQNCLKVSPLLKILSIDSQEFQSKLSLEPIINPNTTTTSAHLAYVIYTSGTTGRPKGVMVEHRGLVNLNEALLDKYGVGSAKEKEVILLFFNYVFDASVEQIIISLLNGNVLLLMPNQLWLHKEKFNNYLIKNKVTHLGATPRFLENQDFCKISSLKRIVFGGDMLSKQSIDEIRLNSNVDLMNVYGPTETSVIATVKDIRNGDLNIGSPIYNTRCYVLADNLAPLPVNATGELYIGGVGLARGYLNRPDLTAERFITNPFQTEEEKKLEKNTRLYKTGDLVRWLPDGNLEYIGRSDLQVKIRGYRIELGEIESALLGYEGIEQGVALAKEHGNIESESPCNKYLVGYYVSTEKLDEEAIRRYLGSKLPEFMVPTFLVHLKKLPLTINGKLDRRALPDPEFTKQDNYVAPRDEIEKRICKIWAEVLGINANKVGTHDDFFRLGGDSIISIQLVNRLRKKLQLNVSVKDIFQYKCIARLCENVFRKEPGINSDHMKEKSYWNNILSDYDGSRLNNLIVSESATHSTSIELSQEYTKLLLQESNRAYHTQINDLLLTALGYSLTELTGNNTNHILLESHDHEEIDSSIDITRKLGWFTRMYPFRLQIFSDLGTSIKSVKESLRTIPNRGIGFGQIFGYNSSVLPRVSYNYIGELDQENSREIKNEYKLRMAEEDSGISISPENRDGNVINFNGVITDGRLKFNIISKLDEKSTTNLATVFKQNILALIYHCTNIARVEYTMSDFKDFEPYVVYNEETIDCNNLFMFPPSFGGAECYFRNIVPRLRNKRLIIFNNFYNHAAKNLDETYIRNIKFEKLAEEYVTYMKIIQPKGPYNLFGWSFGGILAFEISKILISRDNCVANLILLDAYFNHTNISSKIDDKASLPDDINFRHTASSNTEMRNTNIILFKATKVEDIDSYKSIFDTFEKEVPKKEIAEMRNIAKYFTETTKANNLDEVVKNHKIQIVPINSSHYSWVYNADVINEICTQLEAL